MWMPCTTSLDPLALGSSVYNCASKCYTPKLSTSSGSVQTFSCAMIGIVAYLPHEAVAEVSKNKEPIGRRCGIQLVAKSTDFRFNCFELQLF